MKNDVDQLIFQTDKTLKELEGKVSDEELQKAKDAKEELVKAQQENNLEDMKTKRDALSEIVQELTVKLYQQAQEAQQAAGGAEGNATDAKTDDGTVDGDFEEVKDDKE